MNNVTGLIAENLVSIGGQSQAWEAHNLSQLRLPTLKAVETLSLLSPFDLLSLEFEAGGEVAL